MGIGTTTPSYTVDIKGNDSYKTRWDFSSSNDMIINSYYSHPRLIPTVSNTGYIGYPGNYFCYGYFKYLYYTTNCAQYSDIRIKKNIRSLSSSLDKVIKLKGVEYDLKNLPGSDSTKTSLEASNKVGFIAQDVNKIIPEVVVYDTNSNLYAIDYVSLIPYLVEAIKEQNQEINNLKALNKAQLKSAGGSNSSSVSTLSSVLYQNKPNPFNQETSIAYNIPSTASQANLYIYDLQGKQIKDISINDRGEGSIKIYANELQAGMYKYALIVDGQLIGTDTMILTK